MQCLCNNQCLTDIVLNKHFVKIEDICENYETVKIVIDSFNILKKQKILDTDLEKNFQKNIIK